MNKVQYTLTFNLDDNYDLNDVLESMAEVAEGDASFKLLEAITNGNVEITIKDGKVTTVCDAFNEDDDKKFAEMIALAVSCGMEDKPFITFDYINDRGEVFQDEYFDADEYKFISDQLKVHNAIHHNDFTRKA